MMQEVGRHVCVYRCVWTNCVTYNVLVVPKLGTSTYVNLMPTIILWGIINLIFHKEKWKNRGSNLPKDVQEVSERRRSLSNQHYFCYIKLSLLRIGRISWILVVSRTIDINVELKLGVHRYQASEPEEVC